LFKTILILIFVFLVSQEVLALSRAALISLAAAFVFYLFLKTRWKSYVLFSILAVALIVAVSYQAEIYTNVASTEAVSNDGDVANHFSSVTNVKTDASNLERINRWVCAVEMFKMRPLTGYGPGTYQFEYGQFQTSEFKTYISTNHGDRGNAHSEYLTYLSESGLPGMLLFVCLVLYTVHLGIKNYHLTSDPKEKVILLGILLGLITFYVHGLVNSFMDQDKMAFLVYASVAAIVLFDLKNKKLEKAAQ
jgi:putative inorganic carbon (HCO3(-)) transporter